MRRVHKLAIAYSLSGAAALIYEIAWTRELSEVLGSTVYAVSILLGAFMAGLGLGSWLGGKRADRTRSALLGFAKLELGVGTFGLLTLLVLRALPGLFFGSYSSWAPQLDQFIVLQFVAGFLVMLPPTIMMGASFPFVARAVVSDASKAGTAVGNVYAWNNSGALIGTMLTPLVLVPALGLRGTVLFAAALNFAAAALAISLSGKGWLSIGRVRLAGLAVAAAIAIVLPVEPLMQPGFYEVGRSRSASDFNALAATLSTIYRDDGVYSRVGVLEDAQGQRSLRNGGMTEGSNGMPDRHTTGVLAMAPVLAMEKPDTALVVGLGTGYTSQVLAQEGLQVTTVEINPGVVPAARFFVGDDIVTLDNWTMRIDDARNLLLREPTRYDIITSEPSWPLNAAVAPLFTLEFFELGSGRLQPDGVFVQWLPNYLFEPQDLKVMYKTFARAFPNNVVLTHDALGIEDSEIILVGLKGDAQVDPDDLAAQIRESLADKEMGEVALKPYEDVTGLKAAVTDPSVVLNTDDRPYLEFAVVENRVEKYARERK